jgi:hypothetical protein
VVVGQQFVHIQGWRKRGRKTLADVAPPRPSMKTLQENWIKKKSRLKRWQIPLPGLPLPISFSFSIFNFCFRTFCLPVPCFPTFFLPRSLIVLDRVVSNYLSTPPLRVCVSLTLVFQKRLFSVQPLIDIPRPKILHTYVWLLDVEDNVLLIIIERILSYNIGTPILCSCSQY